MASRCGVVKARVAMYLGFNRTAQRDAPYSVQRYIATGPTRSTSHAPTCPKFANKAVTGREVQLVHSLGSPASDRRTLLILLQDCWTVAPGRLCAMGRMELRCSQPGCPWVPTLTVVHGQASGVTATS